MYAVDLLHCKAIIMYIEMQCAISSELNQLLVLVNLVGTGKDTVNRQSKLIEDLFTYKLKQLADKQRHHS